MEKVGVWIVDNSHLHLISERFFVQCLSTNVHKNHPIEHPRGAYVAGNPHKWSVGPQRAPSALDGFSTGCPHL